MNSPDAGADAAAAEGRGAAFGLRFVDTQDLGEEERQIEPRHVDMHGVGSDEIEACGRNKLA